MSGISESKKWRTRVGKSESRLSMIQMLIPLGLQAVEEELQAEVRPGWRRRYTPGPETTCKRWGQNPGSVFLGDQKVRINVPRVRDVRAEDGSPAQELRAVTGPRSSGRDGLPRVINGISQGSTSRRLSRCPRRSGSRGAQYPASSSGPLPSAWRRSSTAIFRP